MFHVQKQDTSPNNTIETISFALRWPHSVHFLHSERFEGASTTSLVGWFENAQDATGRVTTTWMGQVTW